MRVRTFVVAAALLFGSQTSADAGPYPEEPQVAPEGCAASGPATPTCTYRATANGGIGGYSPDAGGWTVTIKRKGARRAFVVRSGGGPQTYQCGIIRPDDEVTAAAEQGSWVSVGNPGICF